MNKLYSLAVTFLVGLNVLSVAQAESPAPKLTSPAAAAKKQTIFIPACDSAEALIGEPCLNEKNQLAERTEKKIYDVETETARTEVNTQRLSRKKLLNELPQLKTKDGNPVNLTEGLKPCSQSPQAGDYCVRKTGKKEHIAHCTQQEGYDPTCKNLNRKELMTYLSQKGFELTSARELATVEINPKTSQAASPVIAVEAKAPTTAPTLEAPAEIQRQHEEHQAKEKSKDTCNASIEKFLMEHPIQGQSFVKLQAEITLNRLLFAFIQGTKITPEEKRSETFGIKSAVAQLLKKRGTLTEAEKAFIRAPITTGTLNTVMPAIKDILAAQAEKSKNPMDPELLLGDMDVKLLGWMAEGVDGKNQPFIQYAKLVNSKVVNKNLKNEDLKAALKSLKKDQDRLVKDMDQLISKAAEQEPSCNEVKDCRIVQGNFKGSKNFEAINFALYKSLKLRSSDLPNLFEDRPVATTLANREPALVINRKDALNAFGIAVVKAKVGDWIPLGKCNFQLSQIESGAYNSYSGRIEQPHTQSVQVSFEPHSGEGSVLDKKAAHCFK